MKDRREAHASRRRWPLSWIIGIVLLAVGIWALYTFWYTPGVRQQVQRAAAPATERGAPR